MALFALARRLREVHAHQLFSFTWGFHRTFSIPSQPPHFTSHFPSLRFFSTQTINYPFSFTPPTVRNDPQEPLLLESLKRVVHDDSEAQAMATATLDESGVKANVNLVSSIIWALKEEWRLAYLAFKWGEKWGSVDEQVCELMIWVLGNCKKFNIAWCLIRDMYKSSFNTRRAMLVMIDRYASANNPSKAIRTFQVMEKFRVIPDEEAFLFLLSALCEHGNVEEAEEFMLVNKKMFPMRD